jgi:magnesium transporter
MFWNTRSIESNQRNTATLSAGCLQGSAGAGGSHTTSGHAALAADELEAQAPALRLATWTEIEPALKGRILVELHLDVRQQLIAASTMGELADALHELDLDELSDLYPQLPAAVGDAVLSAMDIQRREKFDLVRAYPDDSAGGLMDTDTLAVQPDTTLATAAPYLVTARGERGDLPRALDALHVVDADSIYLGRLSLVDLVSLDKDLRACNSISNSLM